MRMSPVLFRYTQSANECFATSQSSLKPVAVTDITDYSCPQSTSSNNSRHHVVDTAFIVLLAPPLLFSCVNYFGKRVGFSRIFNTVLCMLFVNYRSNFSLFPFPHFGLSFEARTIQNAVLFQIVKQWLNKIPQLLLSLSQLRRDIWHL